MVPPEVESLRTYPIEEIVKMRFPTTDPVVRFTWRTSEFSCSGWFVVDDGMLETEEIAEHKLVVVHRDMGMPPMYWKDGYTFCTKTFDVGLRAMWIPPYEWESAHVKVWEE